MACSVDPNENLAKAEWQIREAPARRADRCLPELFRSQYFCARKMPLLRPGRASAWATVEAYRGWPRVGGGDHWLHLRAPRGGRVSHTALVFDADGLLLGMYRKMHIPDDPLYFEKYYFTPATGFPLLRQRYGRIAPLVCWDSVSGSGAPGPLGGAQVLFYPTRLAGIRREAEVGAAQHDAWRTIQRGHAIANGLYVAAANRVDTKDRRSGAGILGRIVRGRSVWPVLAEAATKRGDPDRGVRPAASRSTPPLAVSARPPHRCLPAHPQRLID